MNNLKNISGNIKSKDNLVHFLYLLMRENLPFGHIEKILQECEKFKDQEIEYTNDFLASYAKNISERLK